MPVLEVTLSEYEERCKTRHGKREAAEKVRRGQLVIVPGGALATPLWQPLDGPQTLAYHSKADELFYGGSAGGGKSELVLGLSSTLHRKSIIFRREYGQLKDLISRSREIIGEKGHYNGTDKIWTGIPGNRTLEFGAVQYEHDKQKYKGRPHDLKSFDELPDFLESQYRFLIAWNRTTIPGQRCRVVSTGNPPSTAEGEWVLAYWGPWLDRQHPNPAQPGDLRWYAVVDGKDVEREDGTPFEHKGELLTPKSRTFIPASVQDNPYLLNTGYVTTLQNLPEPLRSQLLYGDFKADRDDDPWQVIPTEWVLMAQRRWLERVQQRLPLGPLSALGVDVARGGKDQTVISRRYGTFFAELDAHPGSSTPDGPGVARIVLLAWMRGAYVNLDVIGIGSSAYDSTVALIPREKVRPVNFGGGSDKTDRSGTLKMRNLRAEGYWGLREALDPVHGEDLALPPDAELKSDLCAPRWKPTPSGILIESKEEIAERIGRSTDKGDAVVYAHMDGPVNPGLPVSSTPPDRPAGFRPYGVTR